MKSDPVLEVAGLSKSFWQGEQEVSVLKGVDLVLRPGDTLAVTGVSGSGKSTLLHLLAGLDEPDAGEVKIVGRSLAGLDQAALGELRNRHLGFIYQFHHLLPEFTALENIAMPLMIGGQPRAEALSRAAIMVEKVGLSHRSSHHPSALSGGERQRVAIARALVAAPDLVLADEPTGNLDEYNAGEVNDLMLTLAAETGTAFMVVTHNNQLADSLGSRRRLHGGILEPVA